MVQLLGVSWGQLVECSGKKFGPELQWVQCARCGFVTKLKMLCNQVKVQWFCNKVKVQCIEMGSEVECVECGGVASC